MSDIILARVSETLATEQSLESLVRQLLEMPEIVTEMESTYLTKISMRGCSISSTPATASRCRSLRG